MRIAVYVISLAILTLVLPAPHLVVERPFNLTPLVPAAGNQSGDVTIGNNYSSSSFLLTSNLSSVNESIWILNCNVTYQGNVLISASGGSINIVNSTIVPESGSGNFSVTCNGNGTNDSKLEVINSSVFMNGDLEIDHCSFTMINSSISGHPVTYRINNSTLRIAGSNLTGFSSRELSGESTDGHMSFSNGPLSQNGTVPMKESCLRNYTADNLLRVNMRYSGNNPGNLSYLYFNLSGTTIYRFIFPDTGSSRTLANLSFTIPVSGEMNCPETEKNLSVYFVYNNVYYSNSTLWNMNISVMTNDSVGLLGIDQYDLVLHDSSMYATDSSLPLLHNKWYSFGREINPLEHGIVCIDSTIFLVSCGSSYGGRSFTNGSVDLNYNSSMFLYVLCSLSVNDHGIHPAVTRPRISPYDMQPDSRLEYNESLARLYGNFSREISSTINSGSWNLLLPVCCLTSGYSQINYFGNTLLHLYGKSAGISISEADALSGVPCNVTVNMTIPYLTSSIENRTIFENNASFAFRLNDSFADSGNCSAQIGIISGSRVLTLGTNNSLLIDQGNTLLTFNPYNMSFPPGNYTVLLSIHTQYGTVEGFNVSWNYSVSLHATGTVSITPVIQKGNASYALTITLQSFFNVTLPGMLLRVTTGTNQTYAIFHTGPLTPGEKESFVVYLGNVDSPEIFHTALYVPSCFTLTGNSIESAVSYYDPQCLVTFLEMGLPNGYLWVVAIAGSTVRSDSVSASLNLTYGSYVATIVGPQGYSYSSTEPVAAWNKSVSVTVDFLPVYYSVVIHGAGIPFSLPFYLYDGKTTITSIGSFANMSLRPGQYSFRVWSSHGYEPVDPVLYLNITDRGYQIDLQFTADSPGVLQTVYQYAVLLEPLEGASFLFIALWIAWSRSFSQRINFRKIRKRETRVHGRRDKNIQK
ncbi:MAG: hypothetical protein ACYDAZ_07545 [Thermoplasmataceae archaeon]